MLKPLTGFVAFWALASLGLARELHGGGSAPVWVKMGADVAGHQTWIRVIGDEGKTEFKVFASGKLVKFKRLECGNMFLPDIPVTTARVGPDWLLFFGGHPGAGSTWYTNYLAINRKTFAFDGFGTFEHGDARNVERTHRFVEYRFTKYMSEFPKLHPRTAFYRFTWEWNPRSSTFRRSPGGSPVRAVPKDLDKVWGDYAWNPVPRDADISTTGASFQHMRKIGFPNDIRLEITPFHGFGNWTVGLMRDSTTLDGVELPLGELDTRKPPRLSKAETPGVAYLSFGSYSGKGVTRYYLRITQNPDRIEVLHTRQEAEWTPFEVP